MYNDCNYENFKELENGEIQRVSSGGSIYLFF